MGGSFATKYWHRVHEGYKTNQEETTKRLIIWKEPSQADDDILLKLAIQRGMVIKRPHKLMVGRSDEQLAEFEGAARFEYQRVTYEEK